MTKVKFGLVWVFWLISFPSILWYALTISPPFMTEFWGVLAFTLMACTLACLPVVVNGTTIFLSHWVSLAALLSYGLFIEMVMMQLSTIVVMIVMKIGKQECHRYFLNSSMMLITSFVGGLGFFIAGGEVGMTSLSALLFPVFVFQTVTFLCNHVLLWIVTRVLGTPAPFWGKDLAWEALLLCIIFPLGLALYILTESMGPSAVFLLGIPLMTFVLLFRLYNSSETVNGNLQKAAEIGRELTGRLDVSEVLDLFIQKISQTLTVDYACILDIKDGELLMLREMTTYTGSIPPFTPKRKGEGIIGTVWLKEKAVIYKQRKDWVRLTSGYVPENIESIMCVPIIRTENVEGILFLSSKKKYAYEKFQLMIVDVLCSYLSVAVANARHYEATKRESERCSLTKLYNYRYFDKSLEEIFLRSRSASEQMISLIMLDIDHFKSINDTYGHQSGNEILVKLANRLKAVVGDDGILARYGGEEFVVLLQNRDKKYAFTLAETIRRKIAEMPFVVQNELNPEMGFVELDVTASIGVSTAPDDADDPMSLVRHADRALYTGAKQAGRNRVAQYIKG